MHQNWNQTELAGALDIEYPTVVRLLDRVERPGLIVRTAVDGDRPAELVTLTIEVKAQVREQGEISARVRAMLLRDVDPHAEEVALDVLRQIGLALISLTIFYLLPLAPVPNKGGLHRRDFVTYPLVVVGVGLFVVALTLGHYYW